MSLILFPWFMTNYLNMDPEYTGSVGLSLLLLFGVPGIMVYELLRNVLDAIAFRAYNTIHAILSVAIGSMAFWAFYQIAKFPVVDAVNVATGVLFFALGLLTLWRTSLLLELDLRRLAVFPAIQVLVGLGLWSLHVHWLLILVALAATFIAGLVSLQRPWVLAALSQGNR
jgi:hypothetical protein